MDSAEPGIRGKRQGIIKWVAQRPFLAGALCGISGFLALATIINKTSLADWLVTRLL